MSADLTILDGPYLRDILDQPRALETTLQHLDIGASFLDRIRSLKNAGPQRIVLTGMGSSFHALHPLNLKLLAHGDNVVMVETSELIYHMRQLLDASTLIVAVSQSGQSAEMLRLIEVNKNRASIIAVTNTRESLLAAHADIALLTCAGTEFSVSCKTYVTALLVLEWLGEALCAGDLEGARKRLGQAPTVVAAYLGCWQKHVSELAETLQGIRGLFLIGRGASLSAAGCGALIIKESDHFFAEAMSSAAFRHGPFEMIGNDIFVLIFSGDENTRDLNQRLRNEIVENRGRAELIGESAPWASLRMPQVRDCVRPIVEILPVQMTTLALAVLAGREPGQFTHASKVTTIE